MPPKKHARLGPSSAKRWIECPGSIALSDGILSVTSAYAAEGTAAHDLAETCLGSGLDADHYIGDIFNDEVVTEDMAHFVQPYVDHCRKYMQPSEGWEWWLEREVSLASLNPPEEIFGTADFLAYNAGLQRLKVADLKFGQGVLVEVADNVQTMTYALGGALGLGNLPIRDVELTIVQPRISHPDGIVRTIVISYLELIEFAGRLLAAARRTQEPDAPLNPGEWCRFCPASGACPAQQAHALAVAQMDFAIEESVPPAPLTVPLDMLAEWLPKMDLLEAWVKACRARVKDALLAGETVPGWKLVPTRATRKWSNAEEAEAALKKAGVAEGDIYEPRQIRSVPQVEKAVGKKAFRQLPIVDLVVKASSGVKLAPESDPTPAVNLTAGEEFLALPAGDTTQTDRQEEN